MAWVLPLNVRTSKEGYRRLAPYFSIMTLLLLTALSCLLYECLLTTVVDKDARDMSFDYRITHAGVSRYHRMLATAYWPLYLASVTDWEADVTRPSEDIPVVVVFSGPPSACMVCRQMVDAVLKSVGRQPGLVRVVVSNGGVDGPIPQLQTYFAREQQAESLVSPSSVSQMEVDILIDSVIANYVDPHYIPPRISGLPDPSPLYNSLSIGGSSARIPMSMLMEGAPNLKKIGWPRELVYWGFAACPDTSWRNTFFLTYTNVNRPAISSQDGNLVVPRLQVTFLSNQYAYVDWYSMEILEDGRASVATLSNVQLQVLMIPQEGECCAWQLVDAIGVYSSERLVGPVSAVPTFFAGGQVQIEAEIRDLGQPDPPTWPRMKGPALIYCGIIFGGVAFIMLGFTPILMHVIQHNVMVNNGLPPPWYTYSSKYRGW
eukprot:CAMPEP_0117683346 /NCGR_PEP_ID=MMETSP0804-20121206/20330_1 /TAXON_ID=1074897 /ORGANISM="Tetraselmis astigmatica, Strain CCMP880" /LENGTH=430 /DNA_ID=CAMNT_0005493891 /DNA_START=8 /DNA_END=1300 /DNA_ORIENTATION=-